MARCLIVLVVVLFAAGCVAQTRVAVYSNPTTPYNAGVEVWLR